MDFIKRASPAMVNFPDFGVYALESHHSSDFNMDTMSHHYAKLLFVIDGEGKLNTNTSIYSLNKDTALFIPVETPHRIIDTPHHPLSLYVVCIATNCLPPSVQQLLDDLPTTTLSSTKSKQRWHEQFKSLLYEQTMQRTDRSIAIMESVLWMLGQIIRASSTTPTNPSDTSARIQQTISDIEQNFYQQQSLADAANAAGIGERRFSQLFRELTGDSWLNHLRKQRIQHACLLLEKTERSVTAIAFECGFLDLSNFYRAFKALKHCSPLQWRAKQ